MLREPAVRPLASTKTKRLTDAEVAEIRSRRPAIRATLACEGLYLAKEEEALLDQMEDEHLNQEQRDERVVAFLQEADAGCDSQSRLRNLCRDALEQHRSDHLRWLPVASYLAKSSYTANEAKTLARHLMKTGEDPAYGTGVRILREVGERDLEAIVPLHREAMARHRAKCLWSHAPNASWSGLTAIAKALRGGDLQAVKLAERIESEANARCR